jgi:alginate O-acetyltransferase complex protein AlgI
MRRRLLGIAVATLVLIVLVDAVLFYAPVYRRVLDPASSTAVFERALAQLGAWQADSRRDVLVLGDSRIYGGLDPLVASAASGGLRFVNAAVPGTTPRTWYYFDRALDPDSRRYRALVIPVDSYGDDTGAIGSLDAADHPVDAHMLVDTLTPRDVPRFAGSFGDSSLRLAVGVDETLRGPELRQDAQDLFTDPAARAAALRAAPTGDFAPQGAHPFTTELTGLRVDFAHGTIAEPAWVAPAEAVEMERQVLPVPLESPSYAEYRRRWLGPIVARYHAAGVPVLFVRIPTRPIHRAPPPPPSGTLLDFAREDGARLIPQDAYVALEHPALFADHDHLDRAGSVRFSALLGRDVRDALRTAASPVRTAQASAAPPLPVTSIGTRLRELLAIGVPIPPQSYDYVVFLIAVGLVFYLLPRRLRWAWLLLASYYFYARWNASYVFLLAVLTLSDFLVALLLVRPGMRARRLLLALGVGANLGFLAAFKYENFLTTNLALALHLGPDPWAVGWLVPIGISFHTFQSISYLVDVYRERTSPERNLLHYALYIGFFPQLLAGPIVRAGRFFGELHAWRAPEADQIERGAREIVLGMIKKLVIADQFAPVSDAYFGAVSAHPGAPAAWCAVFAFTLQIYFDFSGYSDIAIGSARLLGFVFPDNFRRPYLAAGISDFWRRWHISLSTWLRDYLYIPLGGNRGRTLATLRNLMLTMLLGGLWHGASWTFVAWGGYHGALLCAERLIRGEQRLVEPHGVVRIVAVAVTFVLVMLGWVLFRAQSFGDAFTVLRALFTGGLGPASLPVWPLVPVAVALGVGIAQERGAHWDWRRIPVLVQAGAAASALFVLELCSWPGQSAPFIYFRF